MKRVCLLAAGAQLTVVMSAGLSRGHDEPPKTVHERAEQERLRAKMMSHGVRRLSVWAIRSADGALTPDSSLWFVNSYDRSGNLVEQVVHGDSGTTHSTCLFDDQNRWLEELTFAGDSLVDRTVFVYGNDGLIRQVLSYNNLGDTAGSLRYSYSDSDQTVSVQKKVDRDSLVYSIVYRYEPGSDFKRQREAVQTNADGSVRVRVENQYDLNRRVKKLVFGADGKLTHAFTYLYNSDGEFREIIKTTSGGNITSRQEYLYTPEGLLSEIGEQDGTGAVTRKLHHIYEFYDKDR